MTPGIPTSSAFSEEYTGYQVVLPVFEGPLDLLLFLIKRDEIDIYDIPIVHITEQYLASLRQLWGRDLFTEEKVLSRSGETSMDLDSAGKFLVMASTLMQIKSRMLLPQPSTTEDDPEEDPRTELVEMLSEYRRFKEAALSLRELEKDRQRLFTRPPGLYLSADQISEEGSSGKVTAALIELSWTDLLHTLEKLLQRRQRLTQELCRERFSIADKVAEIEAALLIDSLIPWETFFPESPSRLEIIVTFLALLEVVKKHQASVQQHHPFGTIYICRPGSWPPLQPFVEKDQEV